MSSSQFSAIIEEQIKKWQGLKSQKERIAPLITLSREYGTSGFTMGSLLAKKLQFTLWDQNLVHAIADQTGLSSTFLQVLDEHSRSTVEDLIAGALMGYKGTELSYIAQLYRVVHTIEKKGSGIIIGRGAQFIVAPSKALRVRLVAPLSVRIRSIMEREGLKEKDAEKKIKSIDKDRFDFHKHYFSKDVDDPSFYDLVLNTSEFPSDHAVNVIANSYKEKFGEEK